MYIFDEQICACVPAIRPLLVNTLSPSIRSLGGYVKSFMSSAATRATHSSSLTSKLKTANSSKPYQHDDEDKLISITIHENQLEAGEDNLTNTPSAPKTDFTTTERDITANYDKCNHKLHIEMQQTIELTSLSITPEEQACAQHDRILLASLWGNTEVTAVKEPAKAVVVTRTRSVSPAASATANTTATATASAMGTD